ncbi:thiol-disulfide oxidoreductase DCC family protein [Leadbetterella byssophila]|uniref:thiol-disulfide oxidoreductase DCC family protein n=1 Tax=Leadbetterella byssophila TaxID=316068 RepID=UPI0039A24F4B
MKYTVLYDGSCGFCNFWVKWILQRDKAGSFDFASLQGEFGRNFLRKNGLPEEDWDTLYLLGDDNKFWRKSSAIIRVCQVLGGLYSLANLGKILPLFIRDKWYDVVARNRKKWMGEYCYLPTAEEKGRFLD